MARYLDETGGDQPAALRLYAWNASLSSAFFELLHYSEVLLRNAMHEQLSRRAQAQGCAGAWYYQPGWLLDGEQKDVKEAKERVTSAGHDLAEGRVIAELSFGFWCHLLGKKYDATLWRGALYAAFPHSDRRRGTIVGAVEPTRLLRNRIAHHEPIYGRMHVEDQAMVLNIARWICPTTEAWVSQMSRVPEVLRARP
jgi:hypothetical protein